MPRGSLDDEALAGACRVEAVRGAAVRATHRDTGLSAVASGHRGREDNRRAALRRLALVLATEVREMPGERIEWQGVSPKSARFASAAAFVLDVLAVADWQLAAAAGRLGVPTAELAAFLTGDKTVLTAVNRHRQRAGLRPIR